MTITQIDTNLSYKKNLNDYNNEMLALNTFVN